MSTAKRRESNFDFDALEMVNVVANELALHSLLLATVTMAEVVVVDDAAMAVVAAVEVVAYALVIVPDDTENNDDYAVEHDGTAQSIGDVRNLGASSRTPLMRSTTLLPVEGLLGRNQRWFESRGTTFEDR